ncbi:uncharacterized protein LOC110693763 [Chenopodium quinoa]|uniref:uncharacterized protein LOC110693763 n=1 Tax=Chenopodium quinoa TaxID=63459 RepID=UPI000B781634|nr:uncharacterized protein LOC110693763 [Chenopodium quinoa]
MSSALHHIQFLFKLEQLHSSLQKTKVRTNRKISGVPVFKLQALKRREDGPLKGLIRRCISAYDKHQFRSCELAENHGNKSVKGDEAEKKELVNIVQNSQLQDISGDDSNGNSSRGNGNNNGNGGKHGGDEGQECNDQDKFPGVEWWLWWKWQQACSKTGYDSTRSNMWAVDAAIQAVANEVLEPAVQAIVLKPIKQHVNIDRFVLVLVFVALLISTIQMVAGLAVVSTTISFAGLAVIALAITWRPWKKEG